MSDRQRGGYRMTNDPAQTDLDRVHRWLSEESYWAAGFTYEAVARSIENSAPYSIFTDTEQVGFARVVTDKATFAWICDVFVDQQHRGRGLGTWLIDCILDDLSTVGVPRFLLATKDAHEVYRRSGFSPLEGVHRYMAIDRRPAEPQFPASPDSTALGKALPGGAGQARGNHVDQPGAGVGG